MEQNNETPIAQEFDLGAMKLIIEKYIAQVCDPTMFMDPEAMSLIGAVAEQTDASEPYKFVFAVLLMKRFKMTRDEVLAVAEKNTLIEAAFEHVQAKAAELIELMIADAKSIHVHVDGNGETKIINPS